MQAVQKYAGAAICYLIYYFEALFVEWTTGRFGGQFGHHATQSLRFRWTIAGYGSTSGFSGYPIFRIAAYTALIGFILHHAFNRGTSAGQWDT
ncbi:MAG: hypothetical protein U0Z17_01890 [Bacteroidales bacterium]